MNYVGIDIHERYGVLAWKKGVSQNLDQWGKGLMGVSLSMGREVNSQFRSNGVTTSYGYDGRGMISSLEHKTGAAKDWPFGSIGGTTGTGSGRGSGGRTTITMEWKTGAGTDTATIRRGN